METDEYQALLSNVCFRKTMLKIRTAQRLHSRNIIIWIKLCIYIYNNSLEDGTISWTLHYFYVLEEIRLQQAFCPPLTGNRSQIDIPLVGGGTNRVVVVTVIHR